MNNKILNLNLIFTITYLLVIVLSINEYWSRTNQLTVMWFTGIITGFILIVDLFEINMPEVTLKGLTVLNFIFVVSAGLFIIGF